MTAIPSDVCALVDARAAGHCERCHRPLDASWGYSRQHRRPGGMGGSRMGHIWSPANLVMLCGHATAPGGCHYWAESQRHAAKATGYLLEPSDHPDTVPYRDTDGHWWLLTHDGGKVPVQLPWAVEQAADIVIGAYT